MTVPTGVWSILSGMVEMVGLAIICVYDVAGLYDATHPVGCFVYGLWYLFVPLIVVFIVI